VPCIAHDLLVDVSVPVPFPLSVSVEESEPPLLTSLPDVPKVFVDGVFLEPTLAVAASTDKGSLLLTDRCDDQSRNVRVC